eukprot:3597179-Pyramimonas_sp.AAC.2
MRTSLKIRSRRRRTQTYSSFRVFAPIEYTTIGRGIPGSLSWHRWAAVQASRQAAVAPGVLARHTVTLP